MPSPPRALSTLRSHHRTQHYQEWTRRRQQSPSDRSQKKKLSYCLYAGGLHTHRWCAGAHAQAGVGVIAMAALAGAAAATAGGGEGCGGGAGCPPRCAVCCCTCKMASCGIAPSRLCWLAF